MLLELLQNYYKTTWDHFINEMAEEPAYSFSFRDKCKDKLKEMEKEIISYAKIPNAFEEFSHCIEEMDKDVFSTMIANLDSSPAKYETLYDLFQEHNNIHTSKVIIPDDASKLIQIKK